MTELDQRIASLSPEKRALLEQRLLDHRNDNASASLIPRRSTEERIPLSFSQERLWFLDQLEPGQTTYNEASAYRLVGEINLDALTGALDTIVHRHEILRTTYRSEQGVPVQVINPPGHVPLTLVDLTDSPPKQRVAGAQSHFHMVIDQPFDLSYDRMLRACLYRLAADDHILLLVRHHIASDGWSSRLMQNEFIELYSAHVEGRVERLPHLPIQYADFAIWQRGGLYNARLKRQVSYWRKQLADLPPLDLPTDRRRPERLSYQGAGEHFELAPELVAGLRRLANAENSTLYMLFLTAFSLLLSRYSAQYDIAVGTPTAGRLRSEVEPLLGFFVNTLVMRTDLSGNPTVRELLARVRSVALAAYEHQDVPFAKLLTEAQAERSLNRTPLVPVSFQLLDLPEARQNLPGLIFERLPVPDLHAKFDIECALIQRSDGLHGQWRYATDLFNVESIHRMIGHYQTLLAGMVANPDCPIDDLPILSPDECNLLARWQQGESKVEVHPDLITQFFAQVAQRPNATAIFDQSGHLTYAQLNVESNRLAHYLVSQGIAPGAKIGLCLSRSLRVTVALLAIYKAGGVYVPLDPAYPAERLRVILADAQVGVLLTETQWLSRLTTEDGMSTGCLTLCLDRLVDPVTRQPAHDLAVNLPAIASAYIIYTSGSTGRPKGVLLPHRQILNRLAWMWEHYPSLPDDVGAQKTALNFVDSLWEIFGYLLRGMPTAVLTDDVVRDPHNLVDSLAEYGVTHLWLAPSLLRVLLDTHADLSQRLPRLRFWVASGELLPTTLYRRFQEQMPAATLYNLYGTSEVWDATWFDPSIAHHDWHGASVPIGRPIRNVQTYILSPNRLPAPIGVPGELMIGGVGLADGYVNLPELTATSFVPNPFAPGSRLYRTGDLARWLPDGNIEFLGRNDFQVKLRGHRIELGEIEACLEQHAGVQQAVVVLRVHGDGDARLHGYFVPRSGATPTTAELARFLRARLADVMIPASFESLSSLPLTPSGKIDRKALSCQHPSPSRTAEQCAAPNTVEQKLAAIWEDLLGIEHVGIHDSFFDLGGHSLLGVRLFSRIEQEFGRRLPLALIFRAPTIATLADYLADDAGQDQWQTVVRIQPNGSRLPFFCVHGFGGGVLGYADLAHLLGPDQPFYGLQATGLDGQSTPDITIEAMATRYIAAMRTVQPNGPYSIGGYCFGGVVAFEMARQLNAQGESIALLAVMEGYAPARHRARSSVLSPQRIGAVWHNLPYWWRDYRDLGVVGTRIRVQRKMQQWRKRVLRSLGRATETTAQDLLVDDLSVMPQHQLNLLQIHLRAMRSYQPQPYAGCVTLFAARGKTISSALFGSLDPAQGWGRLTQSGVEIRLVDGGHRNIHLPPHVTSLAAALADCLATCNP
jgi:amino acid adenylation domain-containing protein